MAAGPLGQDGDLSALSLGESILADLAPQPQHAQPWREENEPVTRVVRCPGELVCWRRPVDLPGCLSACLPACLIDGPIPPYRGELSARNVGS